MALRSCLPVALAAVAITHTLASVVPASNLAERQFDGTRPQPGIECELFITPNFDDCNTIVTGSDSSYFGDGDERTVCVNPRACRIWREGNCRISFCNNEDIEVCRSNQEWGSRTHDIIDFCSARDDFGEGGYESAPEPEPWTEVAVRSNDEWRLLMDSAGFPASAYQEISIEENAAEVEAMEAMKKNDESPGDERRALNKRDDSFEVGNRRLNIQMPGAAFEVTGPLQNGATFSAGETETQSVGISASVSLGGSLFEVMTVELGLEVSAEYSISSSTEVSFTIECEGDQRGVVAWRPLFDYYEGTFQPSGDAGHIWVPLDTEPSRGNFEYRCLG